MSGHSLKPHHRKQENSHIHATLKTQVSGAGEMVQWLRALAVLQDDLSQVPGTQAVAKN